jgi:glycosyltransferase involved in cell wall biosynthesis
MLPKPFFSILMPTYNRARLLDRALASVFVQLEQDWELLVMDDGSDDGSWSLLCDWRRSDHRLACWRQANKGQSSSRNRMLEHARGQWVVFLDSDDEFEPHHLAHRRTAIEASPQVDLWISPMRVVGSPLVPCMKDRGRMIHVDQCIGVGMLVIRRESLVLAGGFPELDYAEESALVEHLVARGVRQRRLDERSYVYHRNHPDSITRQRQCAGAG